MVTVDLLGIVNTMFRLYEIVIAEVTIPTWHQCRETLTNRG